MGEDEAAIAGQQKGSSPVKMAANWEIRREGAEAPVYLPTSELFTIRLHYMMGEVEGMAGYIDYCCVDQMSRPELIYMATEFRLDVEGCTVWWFDVVSEVKGLKEIKTDLDALDMATSVGSSKEVYVYVRLANDANAHGAGPSGCIDEGGEIKELNRVQLLKDVKDEEEVVENVDLEGISLRRQCEGKTVDNESKFHESDYSFNRESDGKDVDNSANAIVAVEMEGEAGEVRTDVDVESDYARFEELESCSSTDEEALIPAWPRYTEVNNEVDVKNPQFKIGMKFRSFKQFKEAVRNYGIKNRYVMNFKPNNKQKCKAFCKKGCPFYLWASPMGEDRNTIQIKAGVLKHECARDHVNRHVNAEWIARTYLEQFRANPSWKIAGIIQAVKSNQGVDISRIKAYRAKCIARRLIDSDEESQMPRLLDYRMELMKTPPASTIIVNCDEKGGKVSRKGVRMTCSFCGTAGHNKRYHGVLRNQDNSSGQLHGEAAHSGHANQIEQPAVVHTVHMQAFHMDLSAKETQLRRPELSRRGAKRSGRHEKGTATGAKQASEDPAPQMVTIPVQTLQMDSPSVKTPLRRTEVSKREPSKSMSTEKEVAAGPVHSLEEPLSQVVSIPISVQILDRETPSTETHLRMQESNRRGGKTARSKTNKSEAAVEMAPYGRNSTSKSSASASGAPVLRSQAKHEDGRESNRVGRADKRRKV